MLKEKMREFMMLAIDFELYLPLRMFRCEWTCFLFFESDQMFSPSFANVINELSNLDGSQTTCLINITQSLDNRGEVDSIYFEGQVSPVEYDRELRRNRPATGWLYSMDRHACVNDQGKWLIYCEKENDIAVMSFKDKSDVSQSLSPIGMLNAKPIEQMFRENSEVPYVFSAMKATWKNQLMANYSST